MRMPLEQAAAYLIVAWVKNWRMRLYYETVMDDKRAPWDQANTNLPWLPVKPTMFIVNWTAPRFIASAYPELNTKLWDCKDNAARLRLAPMVMQLDGKKRPIENNPPKFVADARRTVEKQTEQFALSRHIEHQSIAEMRKGNGAAWGVCK